MLGISTGALRESLPLSISFSLHTALTLTAAALSTVPGWALLLELDAYLTKLLHRFRAVRIVQRKFGWREVGEDEDWEIFWTDTSVSIERVMKLSKTQVQQRGSRRGDSRRWMGRDRGRQKQCSQGTARGRTGKGVTNGAGLTNLGPAASEGQHPLPAAGAADRLCAACCGKHGVISMAVHRAELGTVGTAEAADGIPGR